MRRFALPVLLIAALFLAGLGCGHQGAPEHPALESGMALGKAYQAIHGQYEGTYEHVGPETQAEMREHIAPSMNRIKERIIRYNDLVLAGDSAPERRRTILRELRDLSRELSEMEAGQ